MCLRSCKVTAATYVGTAVKAGRYTLPVLLTGREHNTYTGMWTGARVHGCVNRNTATVFTGVENV